MRYYLKYIFCLVFVATTACQMGGDEGKDGGDGGKTDTDLKRVLTFSGGAKPDNILVTAGQPNVSIPIELDVSKIKASEITYTISSKAVMVDPSTQAVKINGGFADGKNLVQPTVKLTKGGANQQLNALYVFNVPTINEISAKKYLVFKIDFYVQYKSNDTVKSETTTNTYLLASRKVLFDSSSSSVIDNVVVLSDIKKNIPQVRKLKFTTTLPDNYNDSLSCSVSSTDGVDIISKNIIFDNHANNQQDIEYHPKDKEGGTSDRVEVNCGGMNRLTDNFYRCDDTGTGELWFIDGDTISSHLTRAVDPESTGEIPKFVLCANTGVNKPLQLQFGPDSTGFVKFNNQGSAPSIDYSFIAKTNPYLYQPGDSDPFINMQFKQESVDKKLYPDSVMIDLKIGNNKFGDIKVLNNNIYANLSWSMTDAEREVVMFANQAAPTKLRFKIDKWPSKGNGKPITLKIKDIRIGGACYVYFNDDKHSRNGCGSTAESGLELTLPTTTETNKEIIIDAYAKAPGASNVKIDIASTCKYASDNCSLATFDTSKNVEITTVKDINVYPSYRSMSDAPFIIKTGSSKHFIIELAAEKDSAMPPYYVHAFSKVIKGVDNVSDDSITDINDTNFKIYKLTVDMSNPLVRRIKSSSDCDYKLSSQGCKTDTTPAKQFFLVEDKRTNRTGLGTGVVVSAKPNFTAVENGDKVWYYKEADSLFVPKPDIDIRGLSSEPLDRGDFSKTAFWMFCSFNSLPHQSYLDHYKVAKADAPSIPYQRIKFSVSSGNSSDIDIAINMTYYKEYHYNKGKCDGVKYHCEEIPQEDNLSFWVNDFSDLRLDFDGFDQPWVGGTATLQRKVIINNYSGQYCKGDKCKNEINYGSYVVTNFRVSLPVGETTIPICGNNDAYGHGENHDGSYSPDLVVDMRGFDMEKGENSTGYYPKHSGSSGLVLTTGYGANETDNIKPGFCSDPEGNCTHMKDVDGPSVSECVIKTDEVTKKQYNLCGKDGSGVLRNLL